MIEEKTLSLIYVESIDGSQTGTEKPLLNLLGFNSIDVQYPDILSAYV